MSDDVTLTHPDGHGPITVPARRGRILVRQGWEYAADSGFAALEHVATLSDEDLAALAELSDEDLAVLAATSTPPTDADPGAGTATSPED